MRLVLYLLVGAAMLTPAAAQPAPSERAALETRKEALFQQMLRNPANLDVTFAYADVAARLGDYEGAASALERMLLFNPNLPRVDLELGALYFRMGSFDLARDYFNKALAARPPEAVRARVVEYLEEIAALERRSHFTGYLFFGTQYQSDANVAPGSPLINSPIGQIILGDQFVKHADVSLFANGGAIYSYDLGTQNRDTLEVTGVGFMNHLFIFDRLDLDLLELTAGPRLRFPNGGPLGGGPASIRPYLIFDEVGLGENQYFDAYGVGLEYSKEFPFGLALRSFFEFRQKNFTNAPDRPLSRGLNGNDKLVSIVATQKITENSGLTLQFDFLDQDTRLPYYSNKSYAFSGAYRIRYENPLPLSRRLWEDTLFLSRTFDNYAAPDPCCVTSANPVGFYPSGFSDRYDRRWRFGITHTIIVSPHIGIVLQLERDIVSSNLSLYGYTSNSVLIGPQIRF
ncbi:MAG TPA: tetratricopeptide repeat protein [Stellaceae bacterium]|nr:tetratricopeptide repeat protein [Stellaceae bacterium]